LSTLQQSWTNCNHPLGHKNALVRGRVERLGSAADFKMLTLATNYFNHTDLVLIGIILVLIVALGLYKNLRGGR